MKKVLLFLLVFLPLSVFAEDGLLQSLDSVLAQRRHYMDIKESRIRHLTWQMKSRDDRRRLAVAGKLFWEYYTYRFDSAMHYARQEAAIAHRLDDVSAGCIARSHLALVYALGGYYSQAEALLKDIKVAPNDPKAAYSYYITGYWIYNYWSGYCSDKIFSPQYDKLKVAYLKQAIVSYPYQKSAEYYYLLGEYAYYGRHDRRGSNRYYAKAVSLSPVNSRTYASSTYCLARNSREEGRIADFEKWIVRSAISDQVNPLKENLALQELAMYLFNKDKNNAERSTHYLYYSMEDAKFYHNRLRILEISRRLPGIVDVYQQQINAKRRSVTSLSMALGMVVLILIVGLVYILKQTGRYFRRGEMIDRQNKELEQLNERLRKTDATRGKYMRLFMDLCAVYIGKMTDYRKLVMRKVKAHQTDDLLKSATSTKLTEQEAAQFYTQFDRAFIELYPTFVEDFNALLRPDSQISLTRDGSLTTEMRIYALVRLGVNESVEIATLLFFSPQTIYNYRTAVRKRAIHPETFEDDVKKLR